MLLTQLFSRLISTGPRGLAIMTGSLVDVSDDAAGFDFTYPFAITRAVWLDCVKWTEKDSRHQYWQHERERLLDVLLVASVLERGWPRGSQAYDFDMFRVPRDGHSTSEYPITLRILLEPGDAGEPVYTLKLAFEDSMNTPPKMESDLLPS